MFSVNLALFDDFTDSYHATGYCSRFISKRPDTHSRGLLVTDFRKLSFVETHRELVWDRAEFKNRAPCRSYSKIAALLIGRVE